MKELEKLLDRLEEASAKNKSLHAEKQLKQKYLDQMGSAGTELASEKEVSEILESGVANT